MDESGHGGDLASRNGLHDQPVFVLACVGIDDADGLQSALDNIRADFQIRDGEFKSVALKSKLAPVANALLTWLEEQGSPVFVEVVDKRFFLAIHLVQYLLCGDLEGGHVDMATRNAMAEFLYDYDAAVPLAAYLEACRTPDLTSVRATIDALWEWLETRDEDIARTTQLLTMFARDRVLGRDPDPLSFLPLADIGPTGKPVWMLPNLQSLTNIYARINQWAAGRLADVEFVHDTQLQYERVLRDAKALLERLAQQEEAPWAPFADYQVNEPAALRFGSSDTDPCIQAADIIAGFTMRHIRRSMKEDGAVHSRERETFERLIDMTDPVAATGINLVMTTQTLHRIGVPCFAPHLDLSWQDPFED